MIFLQIAISKELSTFVSDNDLEHYARQFVTNILRNKYDCSNLIATVDVNNKGKTIEFRSTNLHLKVDTENIVERLCIDQQNNTNVDVINVADCKPSCSKDTIDEEYLDETMSNTVPDNFFDLETMLQQAKEMGTISEENLIVNKTPSTMISNNCDDEFKRLINQLKKDNHNLQLDTSVIKTLNENIRTEEVTNIIPSHSNINDSMQQGPGAMIPFPNARLDGLSYASFPDLTTDKAYHTQYKTKKVNKCYYYCYHCMAKKKEMIANGTPASSVTIQLLSQDLITKQFSFGLCDPQCHHICDGILKTELFKIIKNRVAKLGASMSKNVGSFSQGYTLLVHGLDRTRFSSGWVHKIWCVPGEFGGPA